MGRDVIYRRRRDGKRVISQCGAKNFALVMPDADLPKTIATCMTSFFGNAGQRCLANSNLVVVGQGMSAAEHEAFYQQVVDAFVASAARISVGYGLDESIQMGPLRDPEKKQRVADYIDQAISEGGELLLDGRAPKLVGDYPTDAFLGPTVFGNVSPSMTIAQEEVFGPVAALMKASRSGRGHRLIHANPFGNAATSLPTMQVGPRFSISSGMR